MVCPARFDSHVKLLASGGHRATASRPGRARRLAVPARRGAVKAMNQLVSCRGIAYGGLVLPAARCRTALVCAGEGQLAQAGRGRAGRDRGLPAVGQHLGAAPCGRALVSASDAITYRQPAGGRLKVTFAHSREFLGDHHRPPAARGGDLLQDGPRTWACHSHRLSPAPATLLRRTWPDVVARRRFARAAATGSLSRAHFRQFRQTRSGEGGARSPSMAVADLAQRPGVLPGHTRGRLPVPWRNPVSFTQRLHREAGREPVCHIPPHRRIVPGRGCYDGAAADDSIPSRSRHRLHRLAPPISQQPAHTVLLPAGRARPPSTPRESHQPGRTSAIAPEPHPGMIS